MALAKGHSVIKTGILTDYTKAAMDIITYITKVSDFQPVVLQTIMFSF